MSSQRVSAYVFSVPFDCCAEKTYADTLWLLNYATAHLNAKIRYTASNMILHIHSDASYLSEN